MTAPLVDRAAFAGLAGDVGGEALPGLVADFLAEVEHCLADIGRADRLGRARLAHRLSGMAESFGALALARAAGRLEHAAGDAVAMAALPPLAALTIAAYRALLSSDGGDARSSASQDWRLR